MSDSKGPEDTIRDGNLKVSIWRNEGEKGPFQTASFARTYTNKDGDLRDSGSFQSQDLLRVAELARQAHNRARELRREDFNKQREPKPAPEKQRKYSR